MTLNLQSNAFWFFDALRVDGHNVWADQLEQRVAEELTQSKNGHLPIWTDALNRLPECADSSVRIQGDSVCVCGSVSETDRSQLADVLRAFHPWRKGPFEYFGIPIDTEWRSCLKWDRLAAHVDFRGRRVLDVGSGNGYYGWRMQEAGASLVAGFDPFLLFVFQFELVRRYASASSRHCVLPLSDADLPQRLHWFDVTVSMGVLYHRTSPVDHLQSLWHSLKPGGTLVLETLVLEGQGMDVLVPEDRYAKMRNVWFIPTIPMLTLWLHRTGFRDVDVIDVSRTTVEEQRRTDWMTFESLADFLDPGDSSKTIEGHPAPVRAMLKARRSG